MEFAEMEKDAQGWRIGVDVGGTFTDVVVVDEFGGIDVAKSPTDRANLSEGIFRALRSAAGKKGLRLEQLLSNCGLFVHGTTAATNMLLERKGANVALLTTEGFRDSLEIRRGIRDDIWNHRLPYPPVLVPRKHRFGIGERILFDGKIEQRLNRDAVRSAVQGLLGQGIEAIAIGFLNSFVNDTHEIDALSIVREESSDLWCFASSQCVPIIGEYERISTTVVNAYLGPRIVPYLRRLRNDLSDAGLRVPLLLVQSNGGAASLEEIEKNPAALALSGPAAGVGMLRWLAQALDDSNLLTIEVGGTSCDVTLYDDNRVGMVDQIAVGGYHIALPAIEIHTVSAGGGTIAKIDAGDLLKVGPEGAGSDPGPAAYGLGGTAATITDAQIVLGRLAPGPFAEGAINLDGSRAAAVVKREIADRIEVPGERAAVGVVELMEESVVGSVQKVSVERGHDPRSFTLVAGGGAGALHACAVAQALGCHRVYVPKLAGVFCALGMCNSDVRHDHVRSFLLPLAQLDPQALDDVFVVLEKNARDQLARDGFDMGQQTVSRQLDIRYTGQQRSLTIEIEISDRAAIQNTFEAKYQRYFGHLQAASGIELVNVRVVAVGHLKKISLRTVERCDFPAVSYMEREVYVPAADAMQRVAVFRGADLSHGQSAVGPCVVEEDTTTIFVDAGAFLSVDEYNNYLIEFDSKAEGVA